LEPIFVNPSTDAELIVIDSNYNEDTKAFLGERKNAFYQIVYAPVKENEIKTKRDFSQALNTALLYAESPYVLRCDDSLEFRSDFWDVVAEDIEYFSETYEKWAIIGEKLWQSLNHEKWKSNFGGTGRYFKIDNPMFTFSFGIYSLEDMGLLNGYSEIYDALGWGCFGAKTLIKTSEGDKCISDIVDNKLPVKVLSYNEKKNIFEYKSITKYFKGSTKDWYSLEMPVFYKNRTVHVTGEHPFLTRNGWKMASQLNDGDEIAMYLPSLSSNQREIIIGSLLGDACLTKHRIHHRLSEAHSANQKNYLYEKYRLLNLPHSKSELEYFDERWGTFIHSYRVRTNVNYLLDEFEDFYDVNRRKCVLQKYLDELGILGLSIWFMDDGCISGRSYRLHTESYSLEDVKMISEWFKEKWGLDNIIQERSDQPNHYILVFNKKTVRNWIDSNLYLKKTINGKKFVFPFTDPIKCDYGLQFIPIKRIRKIHLSSPKWRYNIEVEDNHNYIADGLIAHNCEDIQFLHRLLMLGYEVRFDRELMAYSYNHPANRSPFDFTDVYYMKIDRFEIANGKFYAYNNYNWNVDKKKFLEKKVDYIL